MSNYRVGLATAIRLGEGGIQAPRDAAWWAGYSNFVTECYDTPAIEKWRARHHKLPACLFVEGERVFHWYGGDLPLSEETTLEEAVQAILDGAGPDSGHPALAWSAHPRQLWPALGLHFSSYGGDYWLFAVWGNHAFWQGLHSAGTRGLFVLEVGCEYSETFLGYTYDFDEAAWPAWFLLLADLRGDTPLLTRIYPPTAPLEEARARDEVEGSALHFYSAFQGQMLRQALDNPLREPSPESRFENPWEI